MKRIFIIIVIIALFAMAGFGLWNWLGAPIPEDATQEVTPTRRTAPSDLDIPTPQTVGLPDNIAKPDIQQPAAIGSESNYRQFNMTVNSAKFFPDTVIAKEGDTVHIELTATDGDYDLAQPDYGFSMALPKGETKVLEFGAYMSGQFKFYCPKCGGPSSGPVGTLVIAAK